MIVSADRFAHFVAIDWWGAAGEQQRGIAVAQAQRSGGAPILVHPPGPGSGSWSREGVLEWLLTRLPVGSIVGLDLGISLPFADRGAFFPGWSESPADARALWALVDRICAEDSHLGVSGFVDHEQAARHFRRHGGREGDLFRGDGADGRGRLRATERAQARMGCRPTSNFNLVGAAQVGKASLSGMRLLHRLDGRIAVWPVDPLPHSGSVIVEIYTSLAAIAAGRPPGRTKMRSIAELNVALARLGSAAAAGAGGIADHASDALVTAAWLRRAAVRAELWQPPGLASVAATEGWTFGA